MVKSGVLPVLLDTFAQLRVLETVEGDELFARNALYVQNLAYGAGEATLGSFRCSLHEHYERVGLDGLWSELEILGCPPKRTLSINLRASAESARFWEMASDTRDTWVRGRLLSVRRPARANILIKSRS